MRTGEPHSLEDPCRAEGSDLSGQEWLAPAGGNEALCGQVVDMVGLDVSQDVDEAAQVMQICRAELELSLQVCNPPVVWAC